MCESSVKSSVADRKWSVADRPWVQHLRQLQSAVVFRVFFLLGVDADGRNMPAECSLLSARTPKSVDSSNGWGLIEIMLTNHGLSWIIMVMYLKLSISAEVKSSPAGWRLPMFLWYGGRFFRDLWWSLMICCSCFRMILGWSVISEERNFPGRPPVRWSHLLKNLRKSLSHLITCHSLSNNFRCKNHSLPLSDSWQHLGSPLSGSALSTMSSKTEKADVAKAGEDLQAYLEFLGEFSAQD